MLCVAALAAAAALPGCGEDEGGGGGEKAPPAKSGSAAVTVDMKDIKYVPQNVSVKRGGTITWTNSDQVPHTVTKEGGAGPEFDSGTIDAGKTYRRTFSAAGRIDYLCTVHPNQKGSITVE
jgi:plastocyanin